MKKYFFTCIIICAGLVTGAQTKNRVLIRNGTVHVGNGQVFEQGLVSFANGKILMVGDVRGVKIDPRSFDTIIEADGKHIYPALISPNTILGLQEAEAIRPTSDFSEVGNINPHVRSLIAYNTDSKILPTVKTNGVLYTQCTPRSGLISGSSSILATDGWNWEDAVLKADDGIHVNFPKSVQKNGWWAEPAPSGRNTKFDEELSALSVFFDEASFYCKNEVGSVENNIRFEAMRKVFDGSQNLYLHANSSKDMIQAVNFAKKYAIMKIVIVGGKDAWKITSFLKDNNVPVMLNRLHDLPDLPDDDVDITYRTPALLAKDSILFCLQMEGDMEAMQSRNLPFLAGTAAAYGLSKEQALQSVTLNPARIMGVDKMIGSLEDGKAASLVISDGDLLDIRTNKVIAAFVNGKPVDLVNEQQKLYEKYRNKYGLK